MPIEVNGKLLETDKEGYLADMQQWEPAVAEAMAKADKLELSDEHWAVIEILRAHYREFGISPPIRVITRAVGKRMGSDKGNNQYLYGLFPYGPGKQACRYAGLPKPSGCM